jgi:hypothetical protein
VKVFIGHFGVGLAAKRVTPQVSLAILFAAAQLADLLWPVLVAAGVEQVRIHPDNAPFLRLEFISYPYSHSLAALIVWGLLFGYAFVTPPRRVMMILILAALVVSHWVLDFVTHVPDLPIYPGGSKVGLGLWNSTPATLVVEFALYAIGLVIYARATLAHDGIGRWGFLTLATLLAVFYAASLLGAPPSVTAIWTGGLIGAAVILALSWWADRHRAPRTQAFAPFSDRV